MHQGILSTGVFVIFWIFVVDVEMQRRRRIKLYLFMYVPLWWKLTHESKAQVFETVRIDRSLEHLSLVCPIHQRW